MSPSVLPAEPYLGGTAIAAIAGLSKYRSAFDVWRDLDPLERGGVPFSGNTATEWGLRLEDAILAGWSAQRGLRLRRRNEIRHPRFDYMRFHPDAVVVGEPGVVDAKSGLDDQGYGEPGTDEVPPHVRVQLVLYAGVLRRDWWEVARLGPWVWREGLAIYRGDADPELYDRLVEIARDWWETYHVANVPPPPDGTESYRRFLAERFPRETTGLSLVATPEQAETVSDYLAARAAATDAEKRLELAKQRLMETLGDAETLDSPAGRVTWRWQAGSTYTVERAPSRVLRVTAAKAARREAA